MRKLKPIQKDAITFMTEVIESTHKRKGEEDVPADQTFAGKCKALIEKYRDYINTYDQKFDNNKLEELDGTHPELSVSETKEFISLYGYDKVKIAELREKVLTEDDGFKDNFCPICGVNLVNNMDHFLPQSKFALFVIHPRNIIPSCSICNGHKSSNIKDGDKRKFWNPYIDTPPTEEYLFCDVNIEDGIPTVLFHIERGNIDEETFRLIKNTMDDNGQKLLQVFKLASDNYIKGLTRSIENYIRKNQNLTLTECLNDIKNEIDNDFIPNKCECVVKKALIYSPYYKSFIESKLQELGIPFHE